MGTSVQAVAVVVDTGSDELIVIDTSCGSSCTSAAMYDETTSTAFTLESTTTQTKTYGSATAIGYYGTDNVYLDSSKTAGLTAFRFLLVQ